VEIECKFEELGSLAPYLTAENERKKLGRYEGGAVPHGSEDRKWSIAAYIVPNEPVANYLANGLSETQLVEGCIRFLNKKPKRARKLPYGNLACRHFIIHDNKISVSLMTNDRNNKHFWGRGDVKNAQIPSKRGRPRKKK
tara:strand:- start:99 stop:518 length:420 start_codon:yes stop_codon:yes gene_type:complete